MVDIGARLQAVGEQIRAAEREFARAPGAARLLAVSKTRSAAQVREAWRAGQRRFGENYLQEALDKQQELADLDLEWHFIGPLQSNKTRRVAEHFDWVHSVDRWKVAQRLSEQRPARRGPLNLCLQVNLSGEPQKGGVALAALAELAAQVAALPGLRVRGLMTLPAPETDLERQRAPFRALRRACEDLVARGLALDTLSMGMTGDLRAAVAEGATLVRVGTAVFGPR